jgi:glycosyltransferase involved in cell wall biosynthesis
MKTQPGEHSSLLIVRHCGNAHPHLCDYFMRKHGSGDLCRLSSDPGLKSKVAHLRDLIGDFFYMMINLKRIRNAREIIAIGPMAVNVAFLLKLGLLPYCRRVYWFGLFVHKPRWLRILRYPFRLLDSANIQYVLFSEFEKTLYAKWLSLSENRLYYVPYGDLSHETGTQDLSEPSYEIEEGNYFFSGGYSNRDYTSLINVFRDLPHQLIIVCSKLNTEIDESAIPHNITIVRDVSSDVFDAYVRSAKACIIPIAHDTGAAGQSCLLRYMKNRKVIIATDTGIIREYITNGVSGILVADNHRSLAMAVCAVGTNGEVYRCHADAARERFVRLFSGEAIARRLDQMIS